MKAALIAFVFCLSFFLAGEASAHTPSTSFLNLTFQDPTLRGEWAIAIRDLEYSIGLDGDGDGQITWGEISGKRADIERFVQAGLSLGVPGQRCPWSVTELLIDRRDDGVYALLKISGTCLKPLSEGVPLTLDYSLLFSKDPEHRGLARVYFEGQPQLLIFSPANRRAILSQSTDASHPSTLTQFFVEGVWHIWIGFDHILFLLALLFPAVLVLREEKWEPVESFGPAFWSVLKIVTSFTVAHSITLCLASMGIIQLPSKIVETVIAFSVFLAAGNNVFQAVEEKRLSWIAFCFGLIHGFGFAGVMKELGVDGGLLFSSVLLFNLGVEAGQLAIVVCFLPIAFLLRKTWFYRWVVLFLGSLAIAALALHWTSERFLGR